MALITCPECGKSVSDKAYHCPKCGSPFNKQFTCPECGSMISDINKKCPNCGCPLRIENGKAILDIEEAPPQNTKIDIAAVISMIFAILGVLVFPIINIPISIIMGIISAIRCYDNPNLEGGGFRVIAAIINAFNLIFIFWLAPKLV